MRVLEELLSGSRAVCATFPDARQWRPDNPSLADVGMAAFALFFMQSESFLSHQRRLQRRAESLQLPDYGRSLSTVDRSRRRSTPPTPSSGISLPTSASYDANTGLMLSATDPNMVSTSVASIDSMLRPTQINNPDGGKTYYGYTTIRR